MPLTLRPSYLEAFRLMQDPSVAWMTEQRFLGQLDDAPQDEEAQSRMDNGTALHRALEEVLDHDEHGIQVTFNEFDFKSYYHAVIDNGDDLQMSIQVEMNDALLRAADIVRQVRIGSVLCEETFTEKLTLPRNGEVTIQGTADVVFDHQLHGKTVIDWKTTERKPTPRSYAGSIQGLCYLWLTGADRAEFIQVQVQPYQHPFTKARCLRAVNAPPGTTTIEADAHNLPDEIALLADDMVDFARERDCLQFFAAGADDVR